MFMPDKWSVRPVEHHPVLPAKNRDAADPDLWPPPLETLPNQINVIPSDYYILTHHLSFFKPSFYRSRPISAFQTCQIWQIQPHISSTQTKSSFFWQRHVWTGWAAAHTHEEQNATTLDCDGSWRRREKITEARRVNSKRVIHEPALTHGFAQVPAGCPRTPNARVAPSTQKGRVFSSARSSGAVVCVGEAAALLCVTDR